MVDFPRKKVKCWKSSERVGNEINSSTVLVGNFPHVMPCIVCDNFFALKYFDIHLMAIWLCLNAARLYFLYIFSMHGEYNWGDLFVSLESFLYLITITLCSSWSNVEWLYNCAPIVSCDFHQITCHIFVILWTMNEWLNTIDFFIFYMSFLSHGFWLFKSLFMRWKCRWFSSWHQPIWFSL